MKHKALFSSKDKNKKIKYRLMQFLFGAFRVNVIEWPCLTAQSIFVLYTLCNENTTVSRR